MGQNPLTHLIVVKKSVNPNAHPDYWQPIACETTGLGGDDAGTERSELGGSCILIVAHVGLNQPGEQLLPTRQLIYGDSSTD